MNLMWNRRAILGVIGKTRFETIDTEFFRGVCSFGIEVKCLEKPFPNTRPTSADIRDRELF